LSVLAQIFEKLICKQRVSYLEKKKEKKGRKEKKNSIQIPVWI